MKTCQNCNHENKDANKFCVKCGIELKEQSKFCPKCGAKIINSPKFCTTCGQVLKLVHEMKMPEIGKKVREILTGNNSKKSDNSLKLFRIYDRNHILCDAAPKYKQAYYAALKYLTKRADFICGYNDFFHDLEKLFSINDHNNLDIKQVFCILNKTVF